MRLSASGSPAPTYAPPEGDVSRARTAGIAEANAIKDPRSSDRQGRTLPFDLEELDQRLEAALLSFADFHADEPCVWACACFLVDGSEG
jgi:hypothetical protein